MWRLKKWHSAGLSAIEQDKALVIPGLAMKMSMAITRALPLSLLRVVSELRFIRLALLSS